MKECFLYFNFEEKHQRFGEATFDTSTFFDTISKKVFYNQSKGLLLRFLNKFVMALPKIGDGTHIDPRLLRPLKQCLFR